MPAVLERQPARPERQDFAGGRPPLASWFRSVAILCTAEEDRLEPRLDTLLEWIEAYDGWYRTVLGMTEGRNLQYVYGREVSFIGSFLTSVADSLADAAARLRDLGLAVSVTVSMAEALQDPERFIALVSSPGVRSVGLHYTADDLARSTEAVRLTERVLEMPGLSVGVLGEAAVLEAIGLFSSPAYCRSDVTAYPCGEARDDLPGQPSPASPVPPSPCFSRFRVWLDASGGVYPCLGLLGLEGLELHHLGRPWQESVFAGRPYPLDLAKLARHGPVPLGKVPPAGDSGLPSACARHRQEILSLHLPSSSA